MAENFYPFDPARWLDDIDAIEIFLADAFETGDLTYVAAALEVIARSPGLDKLAKQQGLTRTSVESALLASRVQPLDAVMLAIKSIGLHVPADVSPRSFAD